MSSRKMFIAKTLILLALIALAAAEVVQFKPCSVNHCEIAEVRVDPCLRDSPNTACQIRRRKPATMEFEFTPNFDADTLESSLHWVMPTGVELPLITMEKDACKSTKCPVKSGEQQTYKVDIPIESKFPLNTYNIKWNFKAPGDKQCCFTHEIKLLR